MAAAVIRRPLVTQIEKSKTEYSQLHISFDLDTHPKFWSYSFIS